MTRHRCRLAAAAAALATLHVPVAGWAKDAPSPPDLDNGINVAAPKIYDDRTLQLMLLDLGNRMSQLTGLDQTSVMAKIGGLQGSTSSQTSMGLSISGPSVPGTVTTTTSGTPSIIANTGSQYPGVQTTTPGNTLQVQTTTPAISTSTAALPSYAAQASPTAYGVSSIDALNEQVQLNYELMNLRLLLEGALNDDYTPAGLGRRHVTFGFPISVETPRRYRDKAAEVEVEVCNPASVATGDEPILQNVLPKEKTYNVASLISSSQQLGIGAVLANVVSVGGSFFHGRQTYYVVRDQDTIAVQRPETPKLICPGDRAAYTAAPKAWPPDHKPASSVHFAWQFRPVLGRRTIQQGLRQTFAQVGFPPDFNPGPDATKVMVAVQSCWRDYDRKSGIVGPIVGGSCSDVTLRNVQAVYDTTRIGSITLRDNADNTVSVSVLGTYPPGTKVAFGDAFTGDGAIGFSNMAGRLRFTAPTQLIATRGARIVSPDGSEREIAPEKKYVTFTNPGAQIEAVFRDPVTLHAGGKDYPLTSNEGGSRSDTLPNVDLGDATISGAGQTCSLPRSNHIASRWDPALVAAAMPFSDSQVKITLPVIECMEFGPTTGGPFPWVAVLGGKAFGLSDAPFVDTKHNRYFAFLAPRTLIQGQATVALGRLLGGRQYAVEYRLAYANGATSGISIFSSTDTEVTFAVRGSQMNSAVILRPRGITPEHIDDTLLMFTLSKDALKINKQLMVKIGAAAPAVLDLPAVDKGDSDKKINLKAGATVSRSVPQPIAIHGDNLKSVTSIQYLGKPLPFSRAVDTPSLSINQIPPEMLLAEGIVILQVTLTDGTVQAYELKVTP